MARVRIALWSWLGKRSIVNTSLKKLLLTDEQQAVVDHNHDAAVVHAVAGAGKTTAMVARIARLVREKIFAPDKILATSFGRSTVTNLKAALEPFHGCQDVMTRTLHSVGMKIITRAETEGLMPKNNNSKDSTQELGTVLLRKAVKEARYRKLEWAGELEPFDEEDFMAFVSTCKGNLEYADLRRASIPKAAKIFAKQAMPPLGLEWYLDLFVLFEEIRVQDRLLTFDDMLLSAWEVLVSHPDILGQIQALYSCVLVDEFQDVNLVQSELLDLITASHRHYMVIGDDDQTIYEWRGASPRFILEFAKRYEAQKYIISDNFRCTASQIAIANQVIVHNQKREAKHLSLTKGFAGSSHWHLELNPHQQTLKLLNEVLAARAAGTALSDMAVLVRTYAQTPDIETALEKEDVPYRLIGAAPFFERLEIKTLLAYLRLALVEQRLNQQQSLTVEQIEIFSNSLKLIMNRPSRYLTTEFTLQVTQYVLQHNASIARTLATFGAALASSASRHALQLAKQLEWLEQNLEQPVHQILLQLVQRLEYNKYLLRSSAFEEIGEGKVRSIEAFLNYATRFKDTLSLIRAIAKFQKRYQQQVDHQPDDMLTILTIHRAKGLEWEMIFIPDFTEGIIPFGQPDPIRLEEERRLLYVAITRAKRDLHLFSNQEEAVSRFAEEAALQSTINTINAMRSALETTPTAWQSTQALALTKGKHDLRLERYFVEWWEEPIESVRAIAQQAQRFIRKAAQRHVLSTLGLNATEEEFWARFEPLELSDPLSAFDDLQAPSQTVPTNTETQGARVCHKQFGTGTIIKVRGQNKSLEVLVRFDSGETKQLLHKYANLQLV